MRVAVTGSVAYDTIMVFPGRFADHILPDKTHLINLSFLVDRLEQRRGGTAANIAYTMALLGERPLLCAAVGSDFAGYGRDLEAVGVDTSAALRLDDLPTASCYITTDLDDNQITAFYAGAMSRATGVDLLAHRGEVDTVVVAPDAPEGMAMHVEQAGALGARLAFAPAQQIPSLSDRALRAGLESAWLVVGNDYELELVRSRTGIGVEDMRRQGVLVALTRGATGSELHSAHGTVQVPAAPVAAVVDPTGAGDGYLAGLVVGLRRGLRPEVAGRMGALAAAYVVEHHGPQGHHFDGTGFAERYRDAFAAELPGAGGGVE